MPGRNMEKCSTELKKKTEAVEEEVKENDWKFFCPREYEDNSAPVVDPVQVTDIRKRKFNQFHPSGVSTKGERRFSGERETD